MDAPGTRYKVVERGRRLEVIDTWNNNAPVKRVQPDPTQHAPQLDASSAAEAMRTRRYDRTPPIQAIRAPRVDQRGRGMLHTGAWYDDKGPRQILVTQAGEEKFRGLQIVALVALFIAAVMGFLFWPMLFIVPFFVMNEGTRKALRAASTKFLDGIDQPLTNSSAG